MCEGEGLALVRFLKEDARPLHPLPDPSGQPFAPCTFLHLSLMMPFSPTACSLCSSGWLLIKKRTGNYRVQEILIIKNSSPFSYAHIHTFLTCAAVCSCGEDREPSEKSPATKKKAAWKWSMHRQIGRCEIVWRSVAAETQYKPVAPSCAVVLDAINAIQEEEKTNLAHIFIKYPFFNVSVQF